MAKRPPLTWPKALAKIRCLENEANNLAMEIEKFEKILMDIANIITHDCIDRTLVAAVRKAIVVARQGCKNK